jgi:hypothetical protein
LVTLPRARGRLEPPSAPEVASQGCIVPAVLGEIDVDRIVVSSEAFCFARTEPEYRRLRAFASDWSVDLIPVLCLRRTDQWRASWKARIAKLDYPGIRTLSSTMDDIRLPRYFDVAAIQAFWSRLGPVRTVSFDDAVEWDGSVLPSLLEAIDAPLVGSMDKYFLTTRPDDRSD